ncbi:30S ribosomal protein S20 [bacterium HR40]|nr:30S ribosomal protein S20 [bacterium HR40]
MAHTRSAKKRIRQTLKRTLRNKSRKSRIRTFVRKVEEAIANGDYEAARAAFVHAESELRRGVSKGVLHINTAARKISRLARKVKALQPQQPAPAN